MNNIVVLLLWSSSGVPELILLDVSYDWVAVDTRPRDVIQYRRAMYRMTVPAPYEEPRTVWHLVLLVLYSRCYAVSYPATDR